MFRGSGQFSHKKTHKTIDTHVPAQNLPLQAATYSTEPLATMQFV
jgi:hypothetical protein